MGLADKTQTTAGITDTPTWRQDTNGPTTWCGITMSLDVIQGGGSTPPPGSGPPATIPKFIITEKPTDIVKPLVGVTKPTDPAGP
jgi:hypothetical protein